MIEIIGNKEGSEFLAAERLSAIILESWPWVKNDEETDIKIISSAKCYGQKVSDIDIVLIGKFSSRAVLSPFLSKSNADGSFVRPEKIFVTSVCCVIELKDHDPSDIQFIGKTVEVRYQDHGRERWHDASDQNDKQKYSLKRYLEHHNVRPPYITNLVWLRNVSNIDLPKRPHNIIGGNSTWELILNVIAQTAAMEDNRRWVINAGTAGKDEVIKVVCEILTKKMTPTHLDRGKMDKISQAQMDSKWSETLGKKQIVLRGRGGAGKTIILLQLAWKTYFEQGARILILTYNRALMADIQRLFTLLRLPDDIGKRTIQIKTAHSFFFEILREFGIISCDDDFFENYETGKDEVIKYIREKLITPEDFEEMIRRKSYELEWDYIFIDEAQDWPDNERALLKELYGSNHLVLADGVDQFVRNGTPCNWQQGLNRDQYQLFMLGKCLRMKANIARFVTIFAEKIGLNGWSVIPNQDALGGKVIIIEGDYFSSIALHEKLVKNNKADGNQNVDMLICVPPKMVQRSDSEHAESDAGKKLINAGYEVWDGVGGNIRSGYPMSVNQFRIVQYDSCRGLEGWITINLSLDDLYGYKFDSWEKEDMGERLLFASNKELAHQHACRWLMMPLSRAIDTLVINISHKDTIISRALKSVKQECGDIIEWYEM